MNEPKHYVAGYPLGGRGGYWHAIPADQLPAVSARARCGAYVGPRRDAEGYIPWEREPMRPGGGSPRCGNCTRLLRRDASH
jgi:hypothetical protein